ncbi:hypothetical protein ACLOJK_022892 [Asimina triloba]
MTTRLMMSVGLVVGVLAPSNAASFAVDADAAEWTAGRTACGLAAKGAAAACVAARGWAEYFLAASSASKAGVEAAAANSGVQAADVIETDLLRASVVAVLGCVVLA